MSGPGYLALYNRTGYHASLVGLYFLTTLLMLYLFGVFDKPVRAVLPAVLPAVAQPVSTPAQTVITGRPSRIVLPSLGLDIQVQDGSYNSQDGSWSLDFDHAFFAMPSVQPNDLTGNTFIYGHSSTRIFGKLWRLKPGEKAEVHTHNGRVFEYKYQSLRNVQPEDVSVFGHHTAPILTLQTCTGDWNELRRLYEFTLERII